jgi:hypothetical protein
MAVRDSLYCISPDNLTAYFRLERGLETGTLAVPFKIRLNPTELVAGGAVGGYAGNRFRERNGSYGVGLVFASLTSVAVNDTSKNAEVPHSPLGVAVGVGLVYAVAREFQLGLILGYDLFQKPEGTNYKNKPWLSFSVGYAFLNSKTDTATAARALSGR